MINYDRCLSWEECHTKRDSKSFDISFVRKLKFDPTSRIDVGQNPSECGMF